MQHKKTFSFSSMKVFQQCPKKYQEVNLLKNYEFKDTPETLYGKEVHKAIEDYIDDGLAIPDKFAYLIPTVEKIAQINGSKHCEIKMAMRPDFTATDFMDKAAWIRGIADLVIIDEKEEKAIVIDWKTGSHKYPDAKQLELMFLLLSKKYPSVKEFDCYLIFLRHGVRLRQFFDDSHKYDALEYWVKEGDKLDKAIETNTFKAKKSALCPWCPVVTCEKHPKFENNRKT
jgi:PD-(D/E)XK nuclease superfamily